MIRWLQKQSIGVRLCFVFAWCSGFYALLFVLNDAGVTAVSLVILTVFPLFYGAFTQLILAPHLERGAGRVFALGLIPVMVLCAGLLITEFETLICIAILCPVFIALTAVGQLLFAVFLRKAMADPYQETLNASLLLLPVLFVPVFGQIGFPEGHMLVQTEIRIAAPAHVVWDHTYEIDEIKDSERAWTFSHNILRTPVPLDAKVRGTVRDLRWSGDIRFEEHLTQVAPGRHLAWDFVFDARRPLHALDPHLAPQGGIVHMRSGSYSLTSLPEGETLLTLETNYSVTTPVNLYLSLWGEVFLQDFHFAVLSVIKARSEGFDMTITILDGGMGQELIRRAKGSPTPLWSTQVMLDEPGLVADVHRDFAQAGADIATTNTYAIHHDRLAGTPYQNRFAELYKMALDEVKTAGAGRIAGSIGPLSASYRPDLHPQADVAVPLYREIAGLLAPHCNLLICETVASVLHAQCVLDACDGFGLPVWLAVTVDDEDGTRLRSGEALSGVLDVARAKASAILINCSTPEVIPDALDVLSGAGLPFGAYANGFERITEGFLEDKPTVDALRARNDLTPDAYADHAALWIGKGATIVGGCCEVGPDHIAALKRRFGAPAA